MHFLCVIWISYTCISTWHFNSNSNTRKKMIVLFFKVPYYTIQAKLKRYVMISSNHKPYMWPTISPKRSQERRTQCNILIDHDVNIKPRTTNKPFIPPNSFMDLQTRSCIYFMTGSKWIGRQKARYNLSKKNLFNRGSIFSKQRSPDCAW